MERELEERNFQLQQRVAQVRVPVRAFCSRYSTRSLITVLPSLYHTAINVITAITVLT